MIEATHRDQFGFWALKSQFSHQCRIYGLGLGLNPNGPKMDRHLD